MAKTVNESSEGNIDKREFSGQGFEIFEYTNIKLLEVKKLGSGRTVMNLLI